MTAKPIYMDNQSTTAVDPAVMDVVRQYMIDDYGNAGSTTHRFGDAARDAVAHARALVAEFINADPGEIVFTSGATESNNLALRGVAAHPRNRGRHIISVTTEHVSVLDPLARLQQSGFEVTYLMPRPNGRDDAGRIEPSQIVDAVRDDTFLVSVMLANNEIGVLQPLAELGEMCAARNIVLHTDATQAVGRIPVDVRQLQVGLMSFSAHKIYGPKGIGALYVRNHPPRVRVSPIMEGGGQEQGLRSGTLNVPAIAGFGEAIRLCRHHQPAESNHARIMRDKLFDDLTREVPDVVLNGPTLIRPDLRLSGNLNLRFERVHGETLMMELRDQLAVSSGSTCSAANPEPSHVLRNIGLSPDEIRGSIRFGLGRFNTLEQINEAAVLIRDAVYKLRGLA